MVISKEEYKSIINYFQIFGEKPVNQKQLTKITASCKSKKKEKNVLRKSWEIMRNHLTYIPLLAKITLFFR